MRIGIIGTRGYPYVYSGYETFVSELAPRLVAQGHHVLVYCHRALLPDRPSLVRGINLIYLPALETKFLSQLTHSFLSTLHAVFQPLDIVLYVNSANGPLGFITNILGKKTAINVDGLEWMRPKWRGLGSKYFYFSSYLSTRLFDIVISDCDQMADIYKREFKCESVTIAYGANIAHSTRPELLESFGLAPREYYLIVGRLIPDNNADVIVRAFEQSDSRKKLVIVGDVPYKDHYAQSIRKTSDHRILFPGYVRDENVLRELYCNAYAYVHGHEYGGTNPSLLRALACGSCVLALDTVFNREVLKDGEYGLLFKKESTDISRLVEQVDAKADLVDSLRQKSRARITERYTWEKITDQYVQLFQEMLKQ